MPTGKGDNHQHAPVTLDLDGMVLVRSRDPVDFRSDRPYVGQAMRPGFREAFIFSLTSPVLCRDERRQFLWAVLEQLRNVGG